MFNHPRNTTRGFWYSLHAMRADSVNLQSNDYLGLADHPAITDAAINALKTTRGAGVMSQVILVAQGDGCAQRRLESRLGQFIGLGSGILCQSGFDANVGLLQAVVPRGLPVYIDQQAHASLYQGIHAADAVAIKVRHNDVSDLRAKLMVSGPGVIVVDSVYSVSGSRSPLRKIADVAEEFGCLLIVDESHSLGTHGHEGRGLVHELGLTDRVHVVTASLAKAFAARAGFIACSEELTEYLRFTAFPAIFSTALLSHELAPLHATLDVVMQDQHRRDALWRNTWQLRTAIEAAGFDISNGTEQIIGVRCGPVRSAVSLRDALESRGVFGSLFWYPATEWRQSVLRFSVNAGLNSDDIKRVAEAAIAAREELEFNGSAPLPAHASDRQHACDDRVVHSGG